VNFETDVYATSSLQELAITTDREKAAAKYNSLVEYHNDPNYADKWILNSLGGKDKQKNNAEQRAAFITMVLQYHVVYPYALTELADTEADCVVKNGVHEEMSICTNCMDLRIFEKCGGLLLLEFWEFFDFFSGR
jgi:hypothetical protein